MFHFHFIPFTGTPTLAYKEIYKRDKSFQKYWNNLYLYFSDFLFTFSSFRSSRPSSRALTQSQHPK